MATKEITGMTIGQAARRLGVSTRMVLWWIIGGYLSATRTPYGHVLDPAEVERFAQERAARRRRSES